MTQSSLRVLVSRASRLVMDMESVIDPVVPVLYRFSAVVCSGAKPASELVTCSGDIEE
jgi:hypothetical protein